MVKHWNRFLIQRGCGVSTPENYEHLTGHGIEQPTPLMLLRAGEIRLNNFQKSLPTSTTP